MMLISNQVKCNLLKGFVPVYIYFGTAKFKYNSLFKLNQPSPEVTNLLGIISEQKCFWINTWETIKYESQSLLDSVSTVACKSQNDLVNIYGIHETFENTEKNNLLPDFSWS